MKLKEYMELVSEGSEITCWDRDIDSEFYFYKKEQGRKPDPDFPNVDLFTERLIDVLDIVKIRDKGIEVNLYQVLEHPKIVQYAKENLYETHVAEDDSVITMLLFDDVVKNLSYGYEGFSEEMVKCLDVAFGDKNALSKDSVTDINKLINEAKVKSENNETGKGKSEYYKFSDGMFEYYVNKQTGKKKASLDENDVLVDSNLDDFVRE